jgi:hypothetical protein
MLIKLLMAWLAVGIEILLFLALNFRILSPATYVFQIPSLLSSGYLLKTEVSSSGAQLTPHALLELVWFLVALTSLSMLALKSARSSCQP